MTTIQEFIEWFQKEYDDFVFEHPRVINKLKSISDNSPKEENKSSFGRIKFTEEEWAELNNTSSQTEISDEEIEKGAKECFENKGKSIFWDYNTMPSFTEGAKWYREQLKQK
jgi:hypothetical protein